MIDLMVGTDASLGLEAESPSNPDGPTLTADQAAGTQAIIGSDNRVRTSQPYNWFPTRAIGKLARSGQLDMNGKGCTAAMLGPRHVLTNAHCVVNSNGNAYGNLRFAPGMDATNRPLGVHSQTGVLYRVKGSAFKDYAVVGLQDSQQLANVGNFGVAWWNSGSTYIGKYVYNKGYPHKQQQCPGMLCGGRQWGQSKAINRSAQNGTGGNSGYGILYYPLDTTGGHSGSPVYWYLNGSPVILGVHKQSNCQCSSSQCNYRKCPADQSVGPKITSLVNNDVCWMMGVLGSSSWRSHPCT